MHAKAKDMARDHARARSPLVAEPELKRICVDLKSAGPTSVDP